MAGRGVNNGAENAMAGDKSRMGKTGRLNDIIKKQKNEKPLEEIVTLSLSSKKLLFTDAWEREFSLFYNSLIRSLSSFVPRDPYPMRRITVEVLG